MSSDNEALRTLTSYLSSLCTLWSRRGGQHVFDYLVHECWVGHEHPQVDVDGCHHAALQLVLPELHRVHIVELQDQTVNGVVVHRVVCAGDLRLTYRSCSRTCVSLSSCCFLGGTVKTSLPLRVLQNKSVTIALISRVFRILFFFP